MPPSYPVLDSLTNVSLFKLILPIFKLFWNIWNLFQISWAFFKSGTYYTRIEQPRLWYHFCNGPGYILLRSYTCLLWRSKESKSKIWVTLRKDENLPARSSIRVPSYLLFKTPTQFTHIQKLQYCKVNTKKISSYSKYISTLTLVYARTPTPPSRYTEINHSGEYLKL